MNHMLYVRGSHKLPRDRAIKAVIGASGEWLAETTDESLSDGLFNNYRYTAV